MLHDIIDLLSPVVLSFQHTHPLPSNHHSYGRRVVMHYELEYIFEGSGYILVDEVPVLTLNRSLHLRKPGSIVEGVGIYTGFYVLFDLNKNADLFDEIQSLPDCCLNINHDFLLDCFLKLSDFTDEQSIEQKIEFKTVLLNLLNTITQQSAELVDTSNDVLSSTSIKNVINYIHLHYKEDIKVEKLSTISGYSIYHFERLFKKTVGCLPIKYINQYRIMKSKTLLLSTDLSLDEIALHCGFHSYSYFFRTFKKFIGLSPSQYRLSSQTIETNLNINWFV